MALSGFKSMLGDLFGIVKSDNTKEVWAIPQYRIAFGVNTTNRFGNISRLGNLLSLSGNKTQYHPVFCFDGMNMTLKELLYVAKNDYSLPIDTSLWQICLLDDEEKIMRSYTLVGYIEKYGNTWTSQ